MLTEANASGATLRAEIYAASRHLATWNGGATYFNHADRLGTERARTNSSGTLCETTASLPFGDGQTIDELNGGCGNPSPNHFTGLERDAESGLDHTLNRQYPSNLGRWLTPDPGGIKVVKLDDPQTWNMYAYVGNNPTTLTDPTGLQSNSPDDPRNCSPDGPPCLANGQTRLSGSDKPAAQDKSWWSRVKSYFVQGEIKTPSPKAPGAPNWQYSQKTGSTDLKVGDVTVYHAGTGYAGHGEGLNNPANEGVEENYADPKNSNAGPLPRGEYTIGPIGTHWTNRGIELDMSMRLTEVPGETDQVDRSGGYFIHGGNFDTMDSSQGCIAEPPAVRVTIGNSGISDLEVVQ